MPATTAIHIHLDERGIAWIDDTQVKVIEVALDQIARGWSPEEIHFQHPHLSLAQIHGALTYYYEHQNELDAQIRGQIEETARLSAELSDPLLREQLATLKRSR